MGHSTKEALRAVVVDQAMVVRDCEPRGPRMICPGSIARVGTTWQCYLLGCNVGQAGDYKYQRCHDASVQTSQALVV